MTASEHKKRHSVLELFKVGIGPSSSHTVGPMRAARSFVEELQRDGLLSKTTCVIVDVFGSLAATGIGHGTHWALLLGLMGKDPRTLEPSDVAPLMSAIRQNGAIELASTHRIAFREAEHLIWRSQDVLPQHPNAVQFRAFHGDGQLLCERRYYSIGGGFIRQEGKQDEASVAVELPHTYNNAAEWLECARGAGLALWELVERNEIAWHGKDALDAALLEIRSTMDACIDRGLRTEGILPGGLGVKRRAPRLFTRLSGQELTSDPMASMDWLNAYAMAVNEENACGGRVVTAPTNGAAGVLPAVLRYYERFMPGASAEGCRRLLLVAGAIGVLYLENASISGAEVGCQGEVGVACSMAAGGLAAALGAGNDAIEHAAEIGMEHHLGMTCDPLLGLVQIPCIERNAIGAVKAVNACRMAMQDSEGHRVSLDQVMKTMLETGRDMQPRYKETAQAGLAIHALRRVR